MSDLDRKTIYTTDDEITADIRWGNGTSSRYVFVKGQDWPDFNRNELCSIGRVEQRGRPPRCCAGI